MRPSKVGKTLDVCGEALLDILNEEKRRGRSGLARAEADFISGKGNSKEGGKIIERLLDTRLLLPGTDSEEDTITVPTEVENFMEYLDRSESPISSDEVRSLLKRIEETKERIAHLYSHPTQTEDEALVAVEACQNELRRLAKDISSAGRRNLDAVHRLAETEHGKMTASERHARVTQYWEEYVSVPQKVILPPINQRWEIVKITDNLKVQYPEGRTHDALELLRESTNSLRSAYQDYHSKWSSCREILWPLYERAKQFSKVNNAVRAILEKFRLGGTPHEFIPSICSRSRRWGSCNDAQTITTLRQLGENKNETTPPPVPEPTGETQERGDREERILGSRKFIEAQLKNEPGVEDLLAFLIQKNETNPLEPLPTATLLEIYISQRRERRWKRGIKKIYKHGLHKINAQHVFRP